VQIERKKKCNLLFKICGSSIYRDRRERREPGSPGLGGEELTPIHLHSMAYKEKKKGKEEKERLTRGDQRAGRRGEKDHQHASTGGRDGIFISFIQKDTPKGKKKKKKKKRRGMMMFSLLLARNPRRGASFMPCPPAEKKEREGERGSRRDARVRKKGRK